MTLTSNKDGLKPLKRALAATDVALGVMEATGKFHRHPHRSLHARGFAAASVNPLRSRLFAESVGAWAKTGGRRRARRWLSSAKASTRAPLRRHPIWF
jgi:transposase